MSLEAEENAVDEVKEEDWEQHGAEAETWQEHHRPSLQRLEEGEQGGQDGGDPGYAVAAEEEQRPQLSRQLTANAEEAAVYEGQTAIDGAPAECMGAMDEHERLGRYANQTRCRDRWRRPRMRRHRRMWL
eukprot:GHVU01095556.1.p1 GENE.GHVU01095556.1~~GHVU01095556.1.p1  ORF type:complete len:130 (-),score=28.73 GHVU01095556.1:108-497(-)